MAPKRRTRKDKINPKHTFLLSWDPGEVRGSKNTSVKGQFENRDLNTNQKITNIKNALSSVKDSTLSTTREEIIKSLFFASLILALELVLYLSWR